MDVRVAQLLELDPGLGEGLAEEEEATAGAVLPVQVISLPKGAWEPRPHESEPGHLGFLVVEGLLVRRVEVGGGSSVELLSVGDLLRPWQEDASSFITSSWEVLERTNVAMLSERLAADLGRWPAIRVNLLARGVRRSRALAAHGATASIVGIDERLHRLLWQLAETNGSSDGEGVHIPYRLPHRILAELVGARRPSVTSALARLQQGGLVTAAADGGWILHGGPPEG